MIEVQDIFQQYGDNYIRTHKLPPHILKTIINIEDCRTSALGGHVDECEDCGEKKISYNSCRNRHCPKCQTLAKEKWLAARKNDLLPVSYFHIVFTIPKELNYLTLLNQKTMYSILFKASSETLLELARDKKYLGAEIGFTTLLHTWGQNLMNHPHIHCIVPSGGLSLNGTKWINSKKAFLMPVKVVSRKFRGKFLSYLKEEYKNNTELVFTGEAEELKRKDVFQCYIDKLYKTEWVVYCKPPFGSAEHVLEYLGRYTHRVAISNNRIVALENGYVVFKWRDYSDNNTEKFMTLCVNEFIRRFLMHILPQKFVKIRHYGILSNRNRITKLKKCKLLLKVSNMKEDLAISKLSIAELILELTGKDIFACPICNGRMIRKERLEPELSRPPNKYAKIS